MLAICDPCILAYSADSFDLRPIQLVWSIRLGSRCCGAYPYVLYLKLVKTNYYSNNYYTVVVYKLAAPRNYFFAPLLWRILTPRAQNPDMGLFWGVDHYL